MHYFWTECPGCGCHVAVNWSATATGVSGSLRRWNAARTINDGRRLEAAGPASGPFSVSCVCGQALSAVAQAQGGEREANLRVSLKG